MADVEAGQSNQSASGLDPFEDGSQARGAALIGRAEEIAGAVDHRHAIRVATIAAVETGQDDELAGRLDPLEDRAEVTGAAPGRAEEIAARVLHQIATRILAIDAAAE